MSRPSPETLLDGAPCGFVSLGDDSCVLVANKTLLDRLGYAREEVEGCHVEKLFTRATQLFYQTHLFPLVKLHRRAQEVFLLLKGKSGEEIGALCNAVRHTRGGIDYTDCVFVEVQERRKYEDALLRAKRDAEQANARLEEQAAELKVQQQQLQEQATELEAQADALQSLNDELIARGGELENQRAAAVAAEQVAAAANRAKSDFLATMSHELRTPLNAIGGYTQLLHGEIYGPVSESQKGALERITRSQRHLLGLINDVLNLARVETGRAEYSIVDIDIGDVVSELAAMIEPQVVGKGLAYRVELPESHVRAMGDREKLIQILLNLLSNAVKFTDAGGTITLRCVMGSRVRIEVIDTGRGIPPDKLETVFEPFVQVRVEPSKANEGTGLGLAISRNLARGMGGDLSATSEQGKGSTFVVTLPPSDD